MPFGNKDRENFLRIAILIVDCAKDAFISLVDLECSQKSWTFEQFINAYQHEIYHLCFSHRCSKCPPGYKPCKRRVLHQSQLELLLDTNLNYSHAKTGVTTDVLDLTLARCLLINFCSDAFWYSCLNFQGTSLNQFLENNKHFLFHLKQFNIRCCQCPAGFVLPAKYRIIDDTQWGQLFVSNLSPCNNCSRKRSHMGYTTCILSMSVCPGVSINAIDIHLRTAILEHCCPLRKHIDTLVNIRNKAHGHAKKAEIADSQYKTLTAEIKEGILGIASVCGREDEFKKLIKEAKTIVLDETMFERYNTKLLDLVNIRNDIQEGVMAVKGKIAAKFPKVPNDLTEVIEAMIEDKSQKMESIIEDKSQKMELRIKESCIEATFTKQEGLLQKELASHFNEKTFVKTGIVTACSKNFKKHKVFIIIGDRGTGKSRSSLHLLWLFKTKSIDFSILKLTDLKDVKDMVSSSKRFILLLDDVFENINCFDFDATQKEAFDILHALADNGTVKLILTVQAYYWQNQQHLIKSHRLFRDAFEVVLKLSEEEKRKIFLKYCQVNSIFIDCTQKEERFESVSNLQKNKVINLSSASVNHIVQSSPTAGFPHLCFMFTTNRMCTRIGPGFFYHPSELLVQEISTLRNVNDQEQKHIVYVVLVYLFFNENILAKRTYIPQKFNDIAEKCFPGQFRCMPWYKISFAVDEIDSKYIKAVNENCHEEYKIKSSMIAEAVALSFYQVDPESVISVIGFDFIKEVVSLQGYQRNPFQAVMVITVEHYNIFVQRLIACLGDQFTSSDPFKCIERLCEAKFWTQINDRFIRLLTEKAELFFGNHSMEIEYRNTKETRTFSFPIYLILCMSKKTGVAKILKTIFDFIKLEKQHNLELQKLYKLALLSSFEYLIKYGKADITDSLKLIFEEMKKLHLLEDVTYYVNIALNMSNKSTIFWLLENVADHTMFDITTAMNKACKCGSMDIVKLLLDKFDHSMFDTKTAMNKACKGGSMDIVKLLLDKFDHTMFDIKIAMNEACECGSMDIVKMLLDKFDHTMFDMKTAMNKACECGSMDIVKLLLDKFDHTMFDIKIAMNEACKCGSMDIVKVLLDKFDHTMFDMKTAMNKACEYGSMVIVKLLLDKFDHTMFDMKTAMNKACKCIDIVKVLLDKFDHTMFDIKTAMNKACGCDNMDIVKLLLVKFDHTMFDIKTAMNKACKRGSMDIVKLLLDKFDHTMFDMKTAMNEACEFDSMDVVKVLLDKFDHTMFDIKTAMNKACKLGNMDIVRLLLDKFDYTMFDIKTAMNEACKCGSMAIVKVLLDKFDHTMFDMKTAMIIVCENDSRIVELFLEKIDHKLLDIENAINHACEVNSPEIVKLVLESVDQSIFDIKTIIQGACCAGLLELVEINVQNIPKDFLCDYFDKALRYAFNSKSIEIIKLIIDRYGDNLDLNQAMYTAARSKHFGNLVIWLLDRSDDVSYDFQMIMNESCFYGNLNVVQWLWTNTDHDGYDMQSAINKACRDDGNISIVQWIWENIQHDKLDMQKAINNACRNSSRNILEWILTNAEKQLLDMNEAFLNACQYGNAMCIKLLNENIEGNKFDIQTGIMLACKNEINGYSIVSCILEIKSDLSNKYLIIAEACTYCRCDIIDIILNRSDMTGEDMKAITKLILEIQISAGDIDMEDVQGKDEEKQNLILFILKQTNPNMIDVDDIVNEVCRNGWTDILEWIWENIDRSLFSLTCGIETACKNGRQEILTWVLENLEISQIDINLAMNEACSYGWMTEVIWMWENVSHDKFDMRSSMNEACALGRVEIVEWIFNNVDKKLYNSDTVFEAVCRNGWMDIANDILQHLHGDSHCILKATTEACVTGHLNIIKLIYNKFSVDVFDLSELLRLGYSSDKDVVRFLVDTFGNNKMFDMSVIICKACGNGWTDLLDWMLKDTNFETIDWSYGLINACTNGETDIVKLLLKKVDYKHFDFAKAMLFVCRHGWDEIASILLDNISHKDLDLNNGIIEACHCCEEEVVRVIVEKADQSLFDIQLVLRHACANPMNEGLVLSILENIGSSKFTEGNLQLLQNSAIEYHWERIVNIIRKNVKDTSKYHLKSKLLVLDCETS